MSSTNSQINKKTIQDIRLMDNRYVNPIVSDPTKSSLFTKTRDLINRFFERFNQSTGRVPRYLAGARSEQ